MVREELKILVSYLDSLSPDDVTVETLFNYTNSNTEWLRFELNNYLFAVGNVHGFVLYPLSELTITTKANLNLPILHINVELSLAEKRFIYKALRRTKKRIKKHKDNEHYVKSHVELRLAMKPILIKASTDKAVSVINDEE